MSRFARAIGWFVCVGLLVVAGGAVRLAAQGEDAKPAKVIVKIIADDQTHDDKPAPLTVNGKATKLIGSERVFVTPPLKADPKVKYYYTFVATWQPNNYETYTRTRKVYVKPGDTVTVDMTKKDPNILDDIKIRFVPTPKEFVAEMMKLGKVGKDDIVFDLGCGDGRIVVSAVKDFGAKRGVGIDYDPKRLAECKETAEKAKVTEKVEFRTGDVFKGIPDLKDATVVCMYMSDGLNGQMWPILQKTCKPGTRIVTHRFKMGREGEETGPPPEKSVEVFSNELGFDYTEKVHLWTIKGDDKKDKDKDDKKDK